MTTWLSTDLLARALDVTPTQAWRLAKQAHHRKVRRGASRAIEAELSSLESLRPGITEKIRSIQPELAPAAAGDRQEALPASNLPPPNRYAGASDRVKARADRRLQAVLSYRDAIEGTEAPAILAKREAAWLERFRREVPGFRVSLTSVKRRWVPAFEAHGRDGLVDANDGRARNGDTKIPDSARNVFLGWWLDENCRSAAFAIRETRRWAREEGVELPKSDRPFYRLAERVKEFDKRAYRDGADKPALIYPYLKRDYSSLKALALIESDHHQIDVGVRCDDEECRQVHFPWLTAWMDVRSRKVLSFELSIKDPNSLRILAAFRSAVELHGLPDAAYVDNGKDYRSSLGKHFWRDRAGRLIQSDQDDAYFENRFFALGVRVQFAQAYNAKAKLIERLFRTLIGEWQGFDSYRGALGKRTKRAVRLHSNPKTLPTIHDLEVALKAALVEYHARPHRGRGMNGQSPDQVFYGTRIPPRTPDRLGWAQLFWRKIERTVDRGWINIDGLSYRIAASYSELFGARVPVLINPDDLSTILVLDQEGRFVCEAHTQLTPQDAAGRPVTQEHLARHKAQLKELRLRVRAGDPRATLEFQHAKAMRPQILARMAAEGAEVDAQRAAVASGDSSTTYVIPRYSQVARDHEAWRKSQSSASAPLAPERLAIADSTPDQTDAFLESAAREQDRRGILRARPIGGERGGEDGDRWAFDRELSAIRERRETERKEAEGLCLHPGCDDPRTVGEYCKPHWRERN